mmetsp:Transcript_45015/g.105598  ORF Transcript_45015/g.105598 Transcript_45015/m.105598 type:complete len:168 (+) Transcript_45015:488-991(+)
MAQSVITPVSVVTHAHYKFVIFDAPNDANLHVYLQEMQREGVCHVVRVCDGTYETGSLREVGIEVHDWPFPDGDPPPDAIIVRWLSLVKQTFDDKKSASAGKSIGIHCVAGLGRAPVLVAIALIEKGMDPLDAVQTIRGRRRGAINARQLSFLESYKRKSKKDCSIQ